MTIKFPGYLLIAYGVFCAVLGWQPYARDVWLAENIPMWIIVIGVVWIHCRYHQFSLFSLLMMGALIVLHTIGGHYTFERVPFDWFSELFGFERNHYDRIAHFSVGFYAFAIAELLWEKRAVNNRLVLFLFPVFAIFTVAALYEIVEWQYTISVDPEAGIAVLGSQGDIWDAQKDMLADGLGAISATWLFFLIRKPAYGRANT